MGLKIVMVSAEVETLARTGGLGDAVAALAVQLAHMGHDVLVVTPHYGTTRASVPRVPWSDGLVVGEGALAREVRVLELPRVERAGGGTLRTCLVSDPGLFDRAGIYGDTHGPFGDNDLRFSTLSRAALAIAARVFGDPRDDPGMQVTVLSFGFKHGVPADVDLVLDCRFLPNPHWVPALRPQTGRDLAVRDYVLGQDLADAFLQRLDGLLDVVLPAYSAEGKAYLTIAFGCTGGRHRSVAIAEEVARRLRERGLAPGVAHRDVEKGG